MSASGKKAAVILAANFEDSEATSPIEALQGEGVEVTVIAPKTGPLEGKKGAVVEAGPVTRIMDGEVLTRVFDTPVQVVEGPTGPLAVYY